MLKMELRQLEYFIAVASELSYIKAAKKLHISQPAITKQIQLLENELNIELFNKELKSNHKKIELTEEGNYFFIEAQNLVLQASSMKENLFNYKNKSRILKFGVFQMIPKRGILEILKKIALDRKNYLIKIIELGTYEEVNEALLNDHIQLGLSLQYIEDKRFISKTCRSGRLSVLLNKNHPLASNKMLTIRQLKDEFWIDFSAQLKQDRNKIEHLFIREGINRKNNIIQEVNSFEMLEALIELNYGIALLPDFIFFENPMLKLIPIDKDSPLSVEINEVVRYKNGNNSNLVKQIFDKL